ncbi:MAG: hypothetical protein [Olavius algarvensis Gamma 3 endosymbiont]|nr:MAG: hypothetical protein [Olavius algarvensis Gamma 3 endosymbiont]
MNLTLFESRIALDRWYQCGNYGSGLAVCQLPNMKLNRKHRIINRSLNELNMKLMT